MAVVEMGEMIEAMRSMLATQTGKLFGNHSAPVDYGVPVADSDLPFGIIYRVVLGGGGIGIGSFGWPEDTMRVGVQVSTVSRDARQAAWLLDQSRVAMVARGGSGFVNSIDAGAARVIDRFIDGTGVTEEEGDFITMSDRYELVVVAG